MERISLSLIGVVLFIGGCGRTTDNEARKEVLPSTTEHHTAAATGVVVNATCPIMGGPIDPADVPENLTREWNGQTVGFCCGSCLGAWDELSDADKGQKLKDAMGGTEDHNGHMDH